MTTDIDPTKAPQDEALHAEELAAGDLLTFAREERRDRSRLRWAAGAAILVHAALFQATLPELAAEIEPPPEPERVWVMRPVRFQPPAPLREEVLPPRRTRRVPVPDPTPEDPEPLALAERIESPLASSEIAFENLGEVPSPPPEPGPLRITCCRISPPVKAFAPSPRYPEIARRVGVTGVVILEAVIDENGAVQRVKILKGLPFGMDQAAAEAVRRWKFEPATLDGRPVAVFYNLTVNFQLQ